MIRKHIKGLHQGGNHEFVITSIVPSLYCTKFFRCKKRRMFWNELSFVFSSAGAATGIPGLKWMNGVLADVSRREDKKSWEDRGETKSKRFSSLNVVQSLVS